MKSDNLQRKLAAKSPWLDGLLANRLRKRSRRSTAALFAQAGGQRTQVALTHLGDKPDRARYEVSALVPPEFAEFVLNH